MTDADKAKAKAIVDTWYWQPDSWRRTSFVRFYESAPMASDIFKLVLDYLKSETATSIVMAGKLIELGETWKATDAWYQTMPAEKWQGTESTKVRIYQAFRAESDTSAGPYSVENGCQYAVTHQFYWDVAEVPEVPASSSGVIYALQGVVRDKESGLYSCVLECRTRVQQDVSLYRSGGTVFEETHEEQHLGVQAQNVATTGLAASAANGIVITRKIVKNPDCTSDVINVKTVEVEKPNAVVVTEKTLRGTRRSVTNRNQSAALGTTGLAVGERRTSRLTDGGRYDNETSTLTTEGAGKIGEECEKTVFEHEHVETSNQTAAPAAPNVAAAANGVVVRKSVRRTDEGSYDVTTRTTTETAVTNAIVVTEKTLRGTRRSVTNRNQSAALGTTGLAVGERRTSRLTDGGRYDNETSTLTTEGAGKVGEECVKTVFEHEHVETSNQTAAPAAPDVAAAANGVVVRKSVRRTDEGSYDVTTRTTTETAVSNAIVVFRKTLRGTVVSRTDRNAANALDNSNLAIGETRRTEKTPGGLHNNTVEKVSSDPPGNIGESCEKQTYVHSHTEQSVVAEKPTPVERAPGVGQVLRRQVQKNDLGSYELSDTTVDYSERRAQVSGGSALATSQIVVVHDARSAAATESPSINKDVSIDVAPTERGTFTRRQVVTTHHPKSASAAAGAKNAQVSITVERNQFSAAIPVSPGQNRTVEASVSANDHGSFDKVVRVTNYSPATAVASFNWATERVRVTTTRHDTNMAPTASMGTASAEPDDNGAATTHVAEYTPIPFDSGWIQWESTSKTASGNYRFKHGIRIFCNLSVPPTPPSGSNCSVNAHINKFGKYDGSISYSDLYDWQLPNNNNNNGGIQNGTATFYQYKTDAQGVTWKRQVTVPTVVYYGSGNEGSRAAAIANQKSIAGLSLSGGAIASGAPTEGKWQKCE